MTGRKRWSHLIGRMLRLWKPAGPKPVPVVQTRYDRWTARVMDGQLDFWGENWADLSGTQQYADWQQLIQSRGGTGDPQYYMTRGLLPEVLYAAGGVERELGHLADALAQVQLAADNVLAGRDISAANWPGTRSPNLHRYIFINLLSWARAVRERTSRRYKPGSAEQAGLLSALAPGTLYDTVETHSRPSTTRCENRGSSLITHFTLAQCPAAALPEQKSSPTGASSHASPIRRQAGYLAGTKSSPPNRDMLTYGQQLMAAIEIFVDDTLGALEANRPARVGGPPGRATHTP